MGLSQVALTDIIKKEMALSMVMRECFTAYDITKAIREFIKSEVNHVDVRDIVHNMFDLGRSVFMDNDYLRTQCTFPSNGIVVQVFHPHTFDPQLYINSIDDHKDAVAVDSQAAVDSLREDFDELMDAAREVLKQSEDGTLAELQVAIGDLEVVVGSINNF